MFSSFLNRGFGGKMWGGGVTYYHPALTGTGMPISSVFLV